jgi:hypothetical protein
MKNNVHPAGMAKRLLFSSWLLLTVIACGPKTKIAADWKSPELKPEPFNKLVAIAMSQDEILRRIAENEVVRRLPKGTEGVTGYSLISMEDRGNVDRVKSILREAGVDGAAVFRLVSVDTQFQYNRGTVYSNFWGYYGWAWPMVYDPGYLMMEKVVLIESNVYSVETGDLIWAGYTQTTDPKSSQKVIDDVARLVVRRMKQLGLVR